MKKLTNPVFRNVLISDLSTIKGGRRHLCFPYAWPIGGIKIHNDTVTWWPVKFSLKHELHYLGKFNIEN